MALKEPEIVRGMLSDITGVKFEITNTPDDFQNQSLNPIWFVKCVDPIQARSAPYVNEAWKQRDGSIWFETFPLGDTIDWIEVAYGEDAAARSLDLNYSDFGTKEFQSDFGGEYPLVYQRIQTYVEVANRISRARKIYLELRNNGSKGIVVFTFVTRIEDVNPNTLDKVVAAAVEALREAYTLAMQV